MARVQRSGPTRWAVFGAPVNDGALRLNAIPVMVGPPGGGWDVHRRVFLKGRLGWRGCRRCPVLLPPPVALCGRPGVSGPASRAGPAQWAKLRTSVGGRLVTV